MIIRKKRALRDRISTCIVSQENANWWESVGRRTHSPSGRGPPDATARHRGVDRGRVARPFGFALTDPGMRISRTRLFPEVTRIMPRAASKGE